MNHDMPFLFMPPPARFTRAVRVFAGINVVHNFRQFSVVLLHVETYHKSMTSKNVYVISAIIFLAGFLVGGMVFSALTVFSPSVPDPVSTSAFPPVSPPVDIGDGDTGTGTIGGGSGTIEPTPAGDGGNVACTMEAKLCPDGSYVGRSGPRCEFAECPPMIVGGGQGSACRSNVDCSSGYECLDASPVIREGYSNLRCWKKGMPTPICLSGDTRIGTPGGDVAVKDMKEGMSVWTADKNGKKISARVLKTGKTFVRVGHTVVHLQLSDGRDLYLSSGHKVADGRYAGNLRGGDRLQGAMITSANLIPYTEEYTYDILPSGETGTYFANGVLLQSTIKGAMKP